MRSDAVFGDVVHFAGANLHFHRRAERAEQRGVQALVAVALGSGDVVVVFTGHRAVAFMHPRQRQTQPPEQGLHRACGWGKALDNRQTHGDQKISMFCKCSQFPFGAPLATLAPAAP